tara:strand:- start:767 stop:928 length:162 start_codon:yes stop_codon:yes gene_type:complete
MAADNPRSNADRRIGILAERINRVATEIADDLAAWMPGLGSRRYDPVAIDDAF